MAKDLYQILGVARDASAEDVKKTYRKLAGDLHPDRNPDPSAAERFKEVSAAYAVLGDEEKRKTYDEFGPDGLRDGFDAEAARNYQRWAGGMGGMGGMGGGMPFDFSNMGGYGGFGDLGDLLGSLFGGGGMPRPQVRKGADLEGQAVISVRQAIEGTELGVDGGKVRVPKGVAEGQRIRLSGRGQQGAAGRGDLYITVKIATPPGFEREGDDLTLDVPLRVSQAIAGGQVEGLQNQASQEIGRAQTPKDEADAAGLHQCEDHAEEQQREDRGRRALVVPSAADGALGGVLHVHDGGADEGEHLHRAGGAGDLVMVEERRVLHLRTARGRLGGLIRLGLTRDGDHHPDAAQAELIPRAQALFGDLVAIDEGAGGAAEVQDDHVIRPVDLHHRVHPRDGLVVDAHVGGRQLPDLDRLLGQDLATNELIALVDVELDWRACVVHGTPGGLRYPQRTSASRARSAPGCG